MESCIRKGKTDLKNDVTPSIAPNTLRYALAELSDTDWENFYRRLSVFVAKTLKTNNATNNRKIAEEILQTAIKKALEVPDKYDPTKGGVIAWLWGFAKNELLHLQRDGYYIGDVYRDRQFVRSTQAEDAHENSVATEKDIFSKLGFYGQSVEQQSLVELDEVLNQVLTVEERKILELRFEKGYEPQEIAAQLKIREGAFYTRVHRIKQKLQKAFDQKID